MTKAWNKTEAGLKENLEPTLFFMPEKSLKSLTLLAVNYKCKYLPKQLRHLNHFKFTMHVQDVRESKYKMNSSLNLILFQTM